MPKGTYCIASTKEAITVKDELAGTVYVGARIPKPLHAKLLKRAQKSFTNKGTIIRQALSLFLDQPVPNGTIGTGGEA